MKPSITMRFAVGLLLVTLATSSAVAATATLTYDPVGNIATRTTAWGTTTYTYDAVNRLTAESGPAGNFNYSYDANGSRLSDSGGSYTYSATSNRLTARHGHAVTTDAAGNITSDGLGHTYAYNQRGYLSEVRLNGVLLASYDYDYRGLRNRKVTTAAAPQGAQTILFVYDEAGHLIEELTATGAPIRTYVWRDNTPLAQIEHVPSRKVIYFEVDHLNTPRVARDQAGTVVWLWESDAFGAIQPNQNPSGQGVVTINLRFPGQYYDQETGLHYNGFRYYDPRSGQYIQSDPIGLRGGSFSTYTYVGGNPLKYVDPFGLLTYNKPPPDTVPVSGHTEFMLSCVETCLQRKTNDSSLDLLITGGAETSGHSANSFHYSNQACDIAGTRFNPVTDVDVKECATSCGFGAGQYETFTNHNRDHWHMQTLPGNGVPALPPNLPSS